MMFEARQEKLVSAGNVVRKLAERPNLIPRLVTYETAVEAIPSMGIEIAPSSEAIVMQGLRLQRRHGLLTNDSLIVAAMLRTGFRMLVDRGSSSGCRRRD
jgi:predicted nucleic acid-binding protein